MSVRIITDSASDMTPEEHSALMVLPLSITFGTDVYHDGVDITRERFYELLVEGNELPKTGQVNPFQFSEAIDLFHSVFTDSGHFFKNDTTFFRAG